MRKNYNTKNLALLYDGVEKFYFGTMQREDLFVSELGCFAINVKSSEKNNDFFLGKRNVMILKDAIEGNVYGEDRNMGGENGNLTEYENCFLKKLYNLGEISGKDLVRYQTVFSAHTISRMQHAVVEIKMAEIMNEMSEKLSAERE